MARNKRQKKNRSNLPSNQEVLDSKPPIAYLTTLPDDVLSQVFLWAIAVAKGRLSIHEAPLNLSQTCRYLRTFALSQSRFWSYINLTPSGDHTPKFLLSSLWVARSGNALLDISVDVAAIYLREPYVVDRNISALAKLFFSQSPRWKRFTLFSEPAPSFCTKVTDQELFDLFQLRELDFDMMLKAEAAHAWLSILLKFRMIYAAQIPIAAQLVHLHMSFVPETVPDQGGMLVMLNHCPALECLNLGYGEEHAFPLAHSEADVGPSRTNKRLSFIGISDFFLHAGLLKLLDHGRAPALESMKVGSTVDGLELLADALLSPHIGSLLRRASFIWHSPTSASHSQHRASYAELRDEIYGALCNVTHLELYLHYLPTSEDLEFLSFDATGCRRFPELEYLKMKANSKMDSRQLECMLECRMLHSERFRAVIDTNSWTTTDITMFLAREKVKAWADSGRLQVN